MEPIIFEVIGSPRTKGRPRTRVTGKFAQIYTDAKTKAAEESFLAQALPYRPAIPLSGPLKVSLGFVMPIPKSKSKKWKALALAGDELPAGKKNDLDNLAKLSLDAMNQIFFEDDGQIVELNCVKVYGPVPMTRVRVEALEN